jgi:predicted permease
VGILVGWVALALAGLSAYLVGRRALRLERPSVGSLINVTLQANTGYLGLPVCVALLGSEHLGQAVVYQELVHGPVFFLGVFAVGAAFGTAAGEGLRPRATAFLTRNPPLLAAIAGLLAPAALAPDAAVEASRALVFAMLPLGFFALGVGLAEEAGRPGMRAVLPPLSPRVIAAVVLRLLVAPALLVLLAAPVVALPDAYVVMAAMPAGITGLVLAHVYGLDLAYTAAAIAWSTAVAVAAIVVVSVAV